MILVNLDSLSLSELKGIAEQEGLSDIDTLGRDDIISFLNDKYFDEDDFQEGEDLNLRYLSGITDYRGIGDMVRELPGVEELPSDYQETGIYLILRNSAWAYCFWSLSRKESDRVTDSGEQLNLAVRIEVDGEKRYVDIPVTVTDLEWNIGLPYGNGSCSVKLVAEGPEGRRVLASAPPVSLIDPYWFKNKGMMKERAGLYKLFHSMVVSNAGTFMDNDVAKTIIEEFKREDMEA